MENSGIIGYENGMRNETELLEAINGKKLPELSKHLQYIVRTMFKRADMFDTVYVEKVPGFAKPDLKFTIGDEVHYLSVKHGQSSQVHCEDIQTFIKWLRENGMSEHIIECFLKYHYADGTLDGTGKDRMNQNKVMVFYEDEVKEINEAFNENRFFVRDLVKRVVFDGNDPSKPSADFIYHGDIEEGEICSMESVLKYSKQKRCEKLNTPHIGRILIRPYARYLHNQDTHPEKRHKVTFDWIRLEWDLEYIKEWGY